MPLEEFESAEPGLCAQIPRSARPGRQRHGHKIHKAIIFFIHFLGLLWETTSWPCLICPSHWWNIPRQIRSLSHCNSLQVIASSSLSGCVSCLGQTFHTRQQVLWPRILSPSAHLGFLKDSKFESPRCQSNQVTICTEQTRAKKPRMWICGYVGIWITSMLTADRL